MEKENNNCEQEEQEVLNMYKKIALNDLAINEIWNKTKSYEEAMKKYQEYLEKKNNE